MNTLSWLIYFAGLAESLHSVIPPIIGLSAFMLIGAGFIFMVSEGELNFIRSTAKISIPIVIASAFLAVVTPTKNTVMMIAASEFGEMAVKSQQVTSIVNPSVDLLKTWIETTTQELKAKAK